MLKDIDYSNKPECIFTFRCPNRLIHIFCFILENHLNLTANDYFDFFCCFRHDLSDYYLAF